MEKVQLNYLGGGKNDIEIPVFFNTPRVLLVGGKFFVWNKSAGSKPKIFDEMFGYIYDIPPADQVPEGSS